MHSWKQGLHRQRKRIRSCATCRQPAIAKMRQVSVGNYSVECHQRLCNPRTLLPALALCSTADATLTSAAHGADAGARRFAPRTTNSPLREATVGNPIGCRTCSARSRSARVCAAEMQTRARALISGVAGKPTTTSATPRSQQSRDAAAILPGWNSITGCTHAESHSGSRVLKGPALPAQPRRRRDLARLEQHHGLHARGITLRFKRSERVCVPSTDATPPQPCMSGTALRAARMWTAFALQFLKEQRTDTAI